LGSAAVQSREENMLILDLIDQVNSEFKAEGFNHNKIDNLCEFIKKQQAKLDPYGQTTTLTTKVTSLLLMADRLSVSDPQVIHNCSNLRKLTPSEIAAAEPVILSKSDEKEQLIKKILLQRILEEDEQQGIPEAQAALEVINGFNLDMITLSQHVAEL